jgi:pimeloyl-ACP methyl ester carboxylesterase
MSDDSDVGLVFVHGAGLGPWIWEGMASLLEAPYLLAEFPRNGAERSLNDYSRHVVGQIDGFKTHRLVLVAHSLGGVVALKVAEAVGERLAGFVGVGAAIPADGGSFVSSLPLVKRVLNTVILRVSGTKPPETAIRRGLCNDLSAEQADEVVRRFSPEARAVYFERTGVPVPEPPRMYVRLTDDNEFGVPLQSAMAHNLGTDDVRDIASGHLPMLSRPQELSRLLNQFVKSLAASR